MRRLAEIQSEDSYVIYSWMSSKLGLQKLDKEIYAIIYSQAVNKGDIFNKSTNYICKLTGYSHQPVINSLKKLTELNYIIKTENNINFYKICTYTINFELLENRLIHSLPDRLIHSLPSRLPKSTTQTLSINNIDNKLVDNYIKKDIDNYIKKDIDNYIKKDIRLIESTSKTKESTSKTKESTSKTKNRYEKCMDYILAFSESECVRDRLKLYLNFRLEIKDKPLYSNQWKGMLRKLSEMNLSDDEMLDVIQQSIDRGYLSFYPCNKKFKSNNMSYNDFTSRYTKENEAINNMPDEDVHTGVFY